MLFGPGFEAEIHEVGDVVVCITCERRAIALGAIERRMAEAHIVADCSMEDGNI